MSDVRVFALGGLAENGKNMYIVEVDATIFVIEAGIMIPKSSLLGVEFVIPDFSYLVKNQKRIGAIFITHAHDDVMRALPYLLKLIKAPVYTCAFTASNLLDYFRQEHVRGVDMHVIERNSTLHIKGIEVRTFGMTHSVPDVFGVAIKADEGYIVYASEFVFDYNVHDAHYQCDINALSEIGQKGVLCLMCESVGVDIEGHTAPRHRITAKMEQLFDDHDGRFIVACYKQSLFRIQEIIEAAIRHDKKIFLHDDNLRKIMLELDKKGYFHIPKQHMVEKDTFDNHRDDIVVIVSGTGRRLPLKMSNIATKEDSLVSLRPNDLVVLASSPVHGTQQDWTDMENEIYKEGGQVISYKGKALLSMHPSQEDIKMAIYLFNPKYYFPVKGEYRHLIKQQQLCLQLGMEDSRIILSDNGQVATFKKGQLAKHENELKLEDTLVDGNENSSITGIVLKDRDILSKDGVIIVGVSLDYKERKINSGIDVQTRGLIYLKNADYIVKEVTRIMEETVTNALKKKHYENIETKNEAREKIARYLAKETGKHPMVLPVIVETNH